MPIAPTRAVRTRSDSGWVAASVKDLGPLITWVWNELGSRDFRVLARFGLGRAAIVGLNWRICFSRRSILELDVRAVTLKSVGF